MTEPVDSKETVQRQAEADRLWVALNLIEESDEHLSKEEQGAASVIARRLIQNDKWEDPESIAETAIERARQET